MSGTSRLPSGTSSTDINGRHFSLKERDFDNLSKFGGSDDDPILLSETPSEFTIGEVPNATTALEVQTTVSHDGDEKRSLRQVRSPICMFMSILTFHRPEMIIITLQTDMTRSFCQSDEAEMNFRN